MIYVAEPFASVEQPGMAWAVYDWADSPSQLVAGTACKTRAQAQRLAGELEAAA